MLKPKSFNYLESLLDQAISAYGRGEFHQTIAVLQPITAMDPAALKKWDNFKAALAYLTGSLAQTGRYREALDFQARLLGMGASTHADRDNFLKLLRSAGSALPSSKAFREALTKTLEREGVGDFVVEAALALQSDPSFKASLNQVSAAPEATLVETLLKGEWHNLLQSPLLRLLMREAVIPVPEFERFFRRIRKAILLASRHERFSRGGKCFARQDKEFIGLLAQYVRLTEYALFEDAEEAGQVADLRRRLETELAAFTRLTESLLLDLALFGLYRPWPELEGADVLFDTPASAWPAHLRPLWREWLDLREERAMRPGIPALTPIGAGISSLVRGQYEENPYPRWKHKPQSTGRVSAARLLTALIPGFPAPARFHQPIDLLVAGCGTGLEAVNMDAQLITNSFLAIDLSRASLAYALRMTRQLEVGEGIEFRQADILELDGLERSFDLITSVGVLHHLEEPLAGWRILTRRLRPGGVMYVGLYSEYAGQTVLKARALIEKRGWEATPENMRQFRREVLDQAHEELNLLPNWRDFYSLSMVRDLVFHVNEHRFTFPKIKACLGELGLTFLGLEGLSPAILQAYRQMFPDDPGATNLDYWARFEEQNSLTFVNMYRFFVAKF